MESDVITLQDLFEFKVDDVSADRRVDRRPAPDRPAARRSCTSSRSAAIALPHELFQLPGEARAAAPTRLQAAPMSAARSRRRCAFVPGALLGAAGAARRAASR